MHSAERGAFWLRVFFWLCSLGWSTAWGWVWFCCLCFLKARAKTRSTTFHHSAARTGDKGSTSPAPLDPALAAGTAPANAGSLSNALARRNSLIRRPGEAGFSSPSMAIRPGKCHYLGSVLKPHQHQKPVQNQNLKTKVKRCLRLCLCLCFWS